MISNIIKTIRAATNQENPVLHSLSPLEAAEVDFMLKKWPEVLHFSSPLLYLRG